MDGLAQDMRSTLPSVSSPASPAPIMSLGHPGGEADRSGQPPQQAPYAAGRICRGYAKYGVCNFPNICIYEHPTELHMPPMGYYPLPGHYMVPPMMPMMHAPLQEAARADVGAVSHESAPSSSNDSTAAGSGPVYEAVVTGASGPVCPDWMQRGNCPQGDACTLQHPPLSVRGSLSSTPTAQSPQLPLPAPASPAGAHPGLPFMMQPPPLDMDPSMPFPGHMMGHPMMNMHMVPPGARMMGMVPPGAVPLPMPMPGMPHMHMSGGPPVSLPPPGSLEASLGPGYRRILCKNWDRDCRYAENCKFFHPPPELAAHYAMIVREHAPSQGPIMVHIPYSVRSAYHLPSRPQQEHHAPGSTPPGPYGGYGQRDRYNRPPRPQNKYYNNAGPNERYNNAGNNTHPNHHHTPHLNNNNNNNTPTNETSSHAGQAHEDKPTNEGPLGPGGGGEDAYPPLPSAVASQPAIPSVPVPSGDASTLPNGTSSSPSSIANTNISPRSAEAAKKKNRNRKKKPNTASPPTSASPSPIPPASSSSSSSPSTASAPPPSVGPRPTASISSSLPAPASAVATHTPHSKPPASYGAARPSGPSALPTSYAQTTRTGHPSSSPSSAPSSAPSSSSSSPSPSSFRPPSAPSFASVSNPGYKSGGFGSAPTGVGRGAPSGRGRGSAAAPRH